MDLVTLPCISCNRTKGRYAARSLKVSPQFIINGNTYNEQMLTM